MKIFGDPLQNAVDQMREVAKTAAYTALMADHHLGYSQPIGGVVAYRNQISPSGVGYDIACGNKAVLTDVVASEVRLYISEIMDEIAEKLSFGVGLKNKEVVEHDLYNDPAWDTVETIEGGIKDLARSQLGTIGSGNHYVDVFSDEKNRLWIGVHFGSRGLGHKIASHFIKAGGGKDGINEPPTLLDLSSELGQQYEACMNLAGRYAYAGRDWVCQKVSEIIDCSIISEVHNHHNFAWRETHFGEDFIVVRKGATPAFPNQLGFVGGSMGENSVILKGIDSELSKEALYSTVHGAGRVMSRNEAAGKTKWKNGQKVRISEGKVSREMMDKWVNGAGVELRGGGCDESPHCYKRLVDVLGAHEGTIEVIHTLTPMGVAMAGEKEFDPFKD